MKKYSIIVPVYNQELYIKECIESLAGQTYPEIEILLINDESTDASLEICREWAKCDERIRVLSKIHTGVGDTRNYGIVRATGEYVLFVDGDDFVDTNYIAQVNEIIEKSTPDMLVTNHMFVYDDKSKQIKDRVLFPVGETIKGKQKNVLEYIIDNQYAMPGGTCFNVYKREFVEKYGCRFAVDAKWSEDLDFFLQVIINKPEYEVADIKYYYYRINTDGSAIANITTEKIRDRFNILRKWYQKLEDAKSDLLIEKLKKWICQEYYANLIFVIPILNQKLNYRELKNIIRADEFLWKNEHPGLKAGLNIIGLRGVLFFIKIEGYMREIIKRTWKK